ncbi:hypothetical protein HG535_0G05060 [Zygotorulaspora mrakii]|uniref:37S ribosomal protein YMR-31, mitochondrial n=1 Tax=Zygotorulaspora mrakii TaxID=42260 RepID=A0A7H9B7Z4_ZYGMR|nr:uncharacterized protein HG535_0G05060 [Zygotorulaspora mrakii]QLG74623.1 hypothetical protein HG535_0G05060 [Zygotorulaspora mrakii]
MRPTVTKLARAYTPMIKFVGGKHPIIEHSGAIKAHPCSLGGLLPGSKDCVPVSEFLRNQRPFEVIPYKNANRPQKVKSSKSVSAGASKSQYDFVHRPLKDNEVSSISQLPARFRFKPIGELESETINNGGAL